MDETALILAAIESMSKSHDECICALKEEMSIIQRASTVHLSSEMEVVNREIRGLQKRMDIQNGNVATLQAESLKRQQAVYDFRTLEKNHKKRDEWLKKNLFWLIPAFVLFVAIVVIAVDLIGAKVIVEKAVEKITGSLYWLLLVIPKNKFEFLKNRLRNLRKK